MTARVIQCEGKARFVTYRIAARVARRQSHRDGEPYEPYRCRYCNGLHIGTKADKPKPRPEYERMSRGELMKAVLSAPVGFVFLVGLCYAVEMLR